MPLSTGRNSIRKNVMELMKTPESPARRKAIATIAKKHGISLREAQFKQARAISIAQSRKK